MSAVMGFSPSIAASTPLLSRAQKLLSSPPRLRAAATLSRRRLRQALPPHPPELFLRSHCVRPALRVSLLRSSTTMLQRLCAHCTLVYLRPRCLIGASSPQHASSSLRSPLCPQRRRCTLKPLADGALNFKAHFVHTCRINILISGSALLPPLPRQQFEFHWIDVISAVSRLALPPLSSLLTFRPPFDRLSLASCGLHRVTTWRLENSLAFWLG